MPETSMKQKHQRPTSDIILETGRKLLTEVEKSAVMDSNKHVSMLLARSRSLDIVSSPSSTNGNRNSSEFASKNGNENNNSLKSSASPAEERDCEQLNMYVSNSSFAPSPDSAASSENSNEKSVKDKSSLRNYASDKSIAPKSTLLKDKSEYNNNSTCDSINFNESYRSSSNRCSSSSTSTIGSSHSGNEKSGKPKSKRMSLSTLEGGAAFQEVVLKHEPIRITGHLEKRSKVLGWKKFWFVLDGRLLTYYKSKADYESLSACCGCINLGIATSVRPIQIRGCKGYPLQIVTRSQVYYLRSQEKPVLEQWLIAIQEAASSPSSSALASWNSSSQYLRQSFSSQSQWSLDNSTDDISNISDRLGNLPDTFYQQRDRGSLACLSNPSSQVSPVIHKYHSFASLQAPILNDIEDRRKLLLSSTENLRDLQYSKGKPVRNSISTMQHSTSLLVLDSSPQAAELRKELTRKLSIGSTKQSNGDVVADDDGSVPSAKFLLLSAKNKIQLGPSNGENESHDYAEIGEFMEVKKVSKPYENCEVEDATNGKSKSKVITSGNQNMIRADSCEKDGNIYEHIETSDSISNGAAHAPVIWEPLIEGNNTVANNKRFPMHRMNASSNRNSLVSISELPEDMSSLTPSPIKTPVLTSIPETSWRSGVEPFKKYDTNYSEDDMSSCRSESFRSLPCVEKSGKKKKGKAFTGFLSKMFGKNKGKSNKAESLENLQRSMVISGPVDLRNKEMKETKPDIIPERTRPPLTKNNSSETGSRKNSSSSDQQDPKASPLMAGSRMTINNTFVMDELKQKVGHITLKRTQSKEITRDRDRDPEPPQIVEPVKVQNNIVVSRENSLKAKQEPRVPYVPRSTATNDTNKQTPVLVFPMHNKSHESNTDDECFTPLNEQETQIASICLSPEIETPFPDIETPCPEIEDNTITGANVQLKESHAKTEMTPPPPSQQPRSGNKSNTDVDFQNKLAKFNRLSQRLSESFIAAVTSPQVQNSHNIGRSHSCKANRNKGKADDDVIPPLPPKKKNTGSSSVSIYDVPLNNKPVNSSLAQLPSQKIEQHNEENSIAAFIRGITKKNSTPDIVISGNNAKLFGLRDSVNDPKEFRKALNSNSDDNFDVYKSSPSLPPPRPPKPKPPAKPKSFESGLSRSTGNSESSLTSETFVQQPIFIPPPPPMQALMLQPSADVSPTSSKSLDIDVLDGLSDICVSDTKTNNSPPHSTQICPLHPDVSRDDLSLSTLARTPDSLITISDKIATDSLASTPNTEIFQSSDTPTFEQEMVQCPGLPETVDSISINKLEIVIRNNDASPGLILKSPDTESRMDSLERNPTCNATGITPVNTESQPSQAYENIKFATVNTLIQEFETVEENEEMSELYDDFPAEFYTPTPSVFSGYSSEISSTSTDSPVSSSSSSNNPPSTPSSVQSQSAKKHARIDAIRNSGMEQLEAFLSFGSTTSSDDCSFESCVDSFSEDGTSTTNTVVPNVTTVNNNNINKTGHQAGPTSSGINNRTGAISRLGHSSAIGHLQKILTSDVK